MLLHIRHRQAVLIKKLDSTQCTPIVINGMSQVGVGIQARPSDLNRGNKLQHLNESQILQGKSKKYNRLEKVS